LAGGKALDGGREAFRRHAWGEAFARLSAADRETPLEPPDLERIATAAYLLGKESESSDRWAGAYHGYLSLRDVERAARCAFWLAFGLLEKGETARGGGWLARATRLLDDGGRDCVERGYLLLPVALDQVGRGDAAAAYTSFAQAAAIGDRFDDRDLATLARHGQGRALIRRGEVARGVALLDEVMVAVTSGEVSPVIVGTVYCSVISACHDMFDLRRAQEWTEALTRWCDSQPDLVPYHGTCLVRRAEIMQVHGAWPEALNEARRACERLSEPPGQPGLGAAYYQEAELHRLRGDFAAAEQAYRRASKCGRSPEPGLALLRLAQGEVDTATAAIRRVLLEVRDPRVRPRMLAACVEIMLAKNDVSAAREAAEELAGIAAAEVPFLRALSAQASGAVHLAEGRHQAALALLRRAAAAWAELGVPFEGARVRVLIGLACRGLGDRDTAMLELEAAGRVFQSLGAHPDLARVRALSRSAAQVTAGGLTGRETQVLRLVATGKTNRSIAADLAISEKTVARHVSNIFTKLGLSSRAAATAYAYEHGLLKPRA
jgi:DNA-binding CsgD family transcriptional regulator